jgi:hypothetical protein
MQPLGASMPAQWQGMTHRASLYPVVRDRYARQIRHVEAHLLRDGRDWGRLIRPPLDIGVVAGGYISTSAAGLCETKPCKSIHQRHL